MSTRRTLRQGRRDDRGAVAVLFAVLAVVLAIATRLVCGCIIALGDLELQRDHFAEASEISVDLEAQVC